MALDPKQHDVSSSAGAGACAAAAAAAPAPPDSCRPHARSSSLTLRIGTRCHASLPRLLDLRTVLSADLAMGEGPHHPHYYHHLSQRRPSSLTRQSHVKHSHSGLGLHTCSQSQSSSLSRKVRDLVTSKSTSALSQQQQQLPLDQVSPAMIKQSGQRIRLHVHTSTMSLSYPTSTGEGELSPPYLLSSGDRDSRIECNKRRQEGRHVCEGDTNRAASLALHLLSGNTVAYALPPSPPSSPLLGHSSSPVT